MVARARRHRFADSVIPLVLALYLGSGVDPARAAGTYVLEPIPNTWPGYYPPAFAAMNDQGELVGYATNLNNEYSVAVGWTGGQNYLIGLYSGMNTARSIDVANTGDAVGTFFHNGDPKLSTYWLYRNGMLFDFEVWMGDGVELHGVGDGNQVIGQAWIGGVFEGFIWSNPPNGATVILPGQDAIPRAVTGSGIVVGDALFGSVWKAFLWKDGVTLATIEPTATVPLAIGSRGLDVNENGDATGWLWVTTPTGIGVRPFVHAGGDTTVLGLPGPDYSSATGEKIAADGTVLVRASKPLGGGTHWFLWKAGTFTNVSDLIDDPNLELESVKDMAADTRMLVLVTNHQAAAFEYYLLTPTCTGANPYGQGCAGSGGYVPSLRVDGCPQAGGDLTVTIENALGGATAFLMLGGAPGSIPMGAGCNLLTGLPLLGPIGPIALGGSGAGYGSWSIHPTLPATATGSFVVQALVVDAGGVLGHANSNGVEVSIQ